MSSQAILHLLLEHFYYFVASAHISPHKLDVFVYYNEHIRAVAQNASPDMKCHVVNNSELPVSIGKCQLHEEGLRSAGQQHSAHGNAVRSHCLFDPEFVTLAHFGCKPHVKRPE